MISRWLIPRALQNGCGNCRPSASDSQSRTRRLEQSEPCHRGRDRDPAARNFRLLRTRSQFRQWAGDRQDVANSPASIAATGFALAAYPVGVERGFISRAAAVERTLTTLRFFSNSPQGPQHDATGYQGPLLSFFGHANRTPRRAVRAIYGRQRILARGHVDGGCVFRCGHRG